MKDRYWKIRNSHVHKLSFVEHFYCIILNEILHTFRIDIEGLCIQITFNEILRLHLILGDMKC